MLTVSVVWKMTAGEPGGLLAFVIIQVKDNHFLGQCGTGGGAVKWLRFRTYSEGKQNNVFFNLGYEF